MTTAYWEGEEFAATLRTFVRDAVGEPTSFAPLRVRPWSTVWRAETASGVFYAKDNCPRQRHEAALALRLAELAPGHVVPVVAADVDAGLLLTPDLGSTLRESTPPGAPTDVDAWCAITAAGAELQRRVAPDVASLGLTVLDAADAVATVRRHVDELASLPDVDPRHLADADRRVVESTLPDVERWSEQVAALGLPLTLQHNDLHDGNVFVSGDATSRTVRFFDFGDAVASEPLAALRVPHDVVQDGLGCGPDDPRLARVTDAALEVWSDVVPTAQLRAALPAAMQLARLARVESWRRCLAAMSDSELAEYGQAPVRWLLSLAGDGS